MGANQLVMLRGMVFAGVVGSIFGAFCPQILEEGLGPPGLEPLKTHVHAFGRFGDHGVEGESDGGGVVSGDRSGAGLGVSHFFECDTQWDGLFTAVKKGGDLGFGGGSH